MHSFFLSTYRYLKYKRLFFFIGTGIIFFIFGWSASNIEFNEDISHFIPINSKNEQLQKVLATTEFNDNIIVLFSKESGASTENLTATASSFLDSLNNSSADFIEHIQGYVEDEDIGQILDFAYRHAPLYLNPDDYTILSKKLSSDSISAIMEMNYNSLISPSGIVSRDLILKDPLRISFLALKNLNPLGSDQNFKIKDGFLITQDENSLLLFVQPKVADNSENSKQLLENLAIIENSSIESPINIEYYGGPIIAAGNADQIKTDIQMTVGIALIFLMIGFVLFYRNLAIPLILLVPTIFGGLLGLVILYLFQREVSAISLGIGSILIGITLDYALHILTHIRNGIKIDDLFAQITRPILMSSLTTAVAFLCLLFVGSPALQDLGIFAAASVMGASFFALVFIPQAYRPVNFLKSNSTEAKANILDRIGNYSFHKNKFILALLLILLAMSFYTYSKVKFNQDLGELNYIKLDLKNTEKKIDSITNISDKTIYLSGFGKDFQNVLETNDKVYYKLQNLMNTGTIKSFSSLSTLLKSNQNQENKIKDWKNFWTPNRLDSTRSSIRFSAQNLGFKADAFEKFYGYLSSDFTTVNTKELDTIENLRIENFYSKKGNLSTIASRVRLDEENISELKSAFKNETNVFIIDRKGLNEGLLGDLKGDFNTLLLYCSGVVVLLIFLFYRNIKLTIITIVPIILTWLITIGIMGAIGLRFNIFNIIISSFIFGLGVDYSIFITNGMLNKMSNSRTVLTTTKTSILLSVLTTVMGIGVLVLAKHPALHSIATISLIGIFSAMLISFTLQPLLFKLLIKTTDGEN